MSYEAVPEVALDTETILASLSPEHQAVIILREVEGFTYQEVADALDIPRGTVESRIFRARQQLRQAFGEYLGKQKTDNVTQDIEAKRP